MNSYVSAEILNPSAFIGKASTTAWLNGRRVTLFRDVARTAMEPVARTGQRVVLKRTLANGCEARLAVTPATGASAIRMQVKLHNTSARPMTLGPLNVLEMIGAGMSTPREDLKVFVDSGGGWWAGTVDIRKTAPFREQWDMLPDPMKPRIRRLAGKEAPPDCMDGFHNSAGGVSVLFAPAAQRALLLGFLTFNRTAAGIVWLQRKEKNVLHGWAGCDFAGFQLQPGARVKSETLLVSACACPFTALEQYAEEAAVILKPRFPATPPMGWCSWYAYRLKVTEEHVLANAARIKERFPGYDFKYLQIDHGWQYKDICGHWTQTNERFPNGLRHLSDRLGAMDYRLGLWMGIFTVLESAPLAQEHPEWLLKDRHGNPKPLPGRWSWEPHDRVYYLDPTHPGARRFISETLRTLRSQGCRYWKFDFTWGIADNAPNACYHDPKTVKGAATYREGLQTVLDSVGNDYVYWCSNPTNLGFGLGATSMTACDIGNPGFSRARKVEGRTEDLGYFRTCATTILSRWFLHKRLLLLNPDVVEVGPPGTFEEARIRLTLVALSGGQVFLGDDLTKLSDKRWGLLAKCIPPYGKAARPADLFEHAYPDSHPRIWHLPVRKRWGRWEVVALMNLTDQPVQTEVAFGQLGLDEDNEYVIFDFWRGKLAGTRRGAFTVRQKPASTQLYAIHRTPDHPMVVSTDMHVTQGGVELSRVAYDSKTHTLSGKATRQKGDAGQLFIYMPEGYAPSPGCTGKPDKSNRILAVPLRFKTATMAWSAEFQKA